MNTIQETIDRLFPNRLTQNSEFATLILRKLNSGYIVEVGCQSVAITSEEDVKEVINLFLESDSNELRNAWFRIDERNKVYPMQETFGQ